MTFKVLVSDKLAEEGLLVFKAAAPKIQLDVKVGMKPAELLAVIGEYHGLAVRSATQVTPEVLAAGKNLKVVGRAGIGVDNVDLPAASSRGIVVMNTPEGNVVTTAEHAIALLTAVARKIPDATASMRAGAWEKSKFQGKELFNKTLGVIGLGNIGKIVADRGIGLRMKVIAFDPFVTKEKAAEMGVELVDLDGLLRRSDFVTLHVPLLEGTKNIIDGAAIDKMKKGAFLINAARGGLVDEVAVAEALKSKKLAGAAFDVFVTEPPPKDHPLLGLENVVLTPHLGASTDEAQVNVSVAVAEQMVAYLTDGVIRNAVNAPAVSAELLPTVGPYLKLGRKLGKLAGQLHKGGVKSVRLEYSGSAATIPTTAITAEALTGLFEVALGRADVNAISAPYLAKERGIEVASEKSNTAKDFASAVTIRITGDEGSTEIVGALFGKNDVRIVSVGAFRIEIVPDGFMLLTNHRDQPGIIGKIGTVLGQQKVNISRLSLSTTQDQSGVAEAAIAIDAKASDDVLKTIAAVEGIVWVKQVDLR